MSINFPTSLDTLTNPSSTDLMENAVSALDHDVQHSNANDAIEALEAKVGINSSAVTTSHDYKLSAVTSTAKALTSGTSTQSVTGLTLVTPTLTLTSDATGDIYYRNSSGALTRLPIGTAGQILDVSASGIPEWIANPSASNASYSTFGVVKGLTDAATSGLTLSSGVISVNSGTSANNIVKLDSSAKLPAVDGSQLTNIGVYTVNADETFNAWQTVEMAMYPTSTTAIPGWTLASTTVTTQTAGGYILLTPTSSSNLEMSASLMGSGSTANYSPAQNKDIRIKFRLKLNDTSDRKGWGLCVTPANIHTAQTDTTNGEIRFILNGATLYAQNANGTATSTDISSGVTVTNWNNYEIVFNPGTDIKYYVNGTLKATHTTNLPTTGTLVLAFGVSANGRTMDTSFPVVSYEI